MNIIDIKSDVIGKLRKIYEGKSFSDRIVVITELFQNSYRAGAKNIIITLDSDELIFKDDGCGCQDPKNILTLDLSNWESTDEGFGIGLWSWLAVYDVKELVIMSNNWEININVDRIFKDNNPVAEVKESEELIDGFVVKIKADYFKHYRENVINRIISDGELQNCNVYINNQLIEKRNIHNEVKGDFVKSFKNKYFSATLSIDDYFRYPNIYYENREVGRFYHINHISGVIEINKGVLTLQEPDRKNIINDDKLDKFIKVMVDTRKELYKEFLNYAMHEQIDKYADSIASILDVKDYEKYIFIDDEEELLFDEKRNIDFLSDIDRKSIALNMLRNKINSYNKSKQLSLLENNMDKCDIEKVVKLLNITTDDSCNIKWVAVGDYNPDNHDNEITDAKHFNFDTLENIDKLQIGGVIYKKINIDDTMNVFKMDDIEIEDKILVKNKNKKRSKDKLKDVIKRSRRKVWVKLKDVNEYSNLIARAEYYNIKVFIAKNILQENVLVKYNVPYITELEEGIKKRNFIKNVGINTNKEKYYIDLLQPILRYFNLPYNTILIGNLKMYIETYLNDIVVHREIIENNKDDIKIKAVTDGDKILLDRKALGLQRFNLLGKGIGVNELKALFATIDIIAHELAHLLYNTEDNTKEHFEMVNNIREEIVNLYITL